MELLNGKTAVVTGGTRGIGLAIVRVFLRNGAKVALCGSRMETAEKAVAALPEELVARISTPFRCAASESRRRSRTCSFSLQATSQAM